ncbi:MAG: zinc ribbon domain-containing protein [Candidatus Asgardarchaeia archaeon]
MVVLLWFISGLIFGFRHKHIKDSVILGFVTPLAVAQFYIMMLQQYLPNMWTSFSPDFQQKITYLSYFNGFQIGLILTIALVFSTIVNKVRTRKPKEVYTIPEEALAPLEIRCPSCGAIHYSNAIYCSYCGAVMSDTRVDSQTRSGD